MPGFGKMGARGGFGSQGVLGRVSGTTPVVTIPAVTLPVAPAAFYGTVALSGWAGSCCDVVRASDSTSQTIGFVHGQIDMASALTFAGGSALSISKWYDQSGNGLDATQGTAANRPNLNALNVVNGIQAIGFDGSNGSPVITKQLTLPAGVALDITNFSCAFIGRQTASGGTDSSIVALSITGATAANWRVFQGPSLVATSTQTTSTYAPTNPISQVLTRGVTNGTKHYLADRAFARTATTGTGTSAGGIIGNTTVGTERGFFEAVAIVLFASELSTVNATATQTALEAPFVSATSIQRVFTDTVILEGDSICLGTGTTLNQNSTRQLWSALKRPTRLLNNGVFGATLNSFAASTTGHFAIFTGWTQTTTAYVCEACTNDFASASTNQGLAGKPTIAAGGTGYAVSSTFNVTTAGGTGTQAIISVTTNSSGVVTTINNMSNFGAWSVNPASPNSPTGGTGTGLSLNLTFAGINSFAFVQANMIQQIANAKTGIAGVKTGIATCTPRQSWIGARITGSITGSVLTKTATTSGSVSVGQNVNLPGVAIPVAKITADNGDGTYNLDASSSAAVGTTIYCGSSNWVQACAYNADVRANFNTTYGADCCVDVASDSVMGSLITTDDTSKYTDSLHPSNAGWALMVPYYTAQINALLP
jgi:hypothetical protein